MTWCLFKTFRLKCHCNLSISAADFMERKPHYDQCFVSWCSELHPWMKYHWNVNLNETNLVQRKPHYFSSCKEFYLRFCGATWSTSWEATPSTCWLVWCRTRRSSVCRPSDIRLMETPASTTSSDCWPGRTQTSWTTSTRYTPPSTTRTWRRIYSPPVTRSIIPSYRSVCRRIEMIGRMTVISWRVWKSFQGEENIFCFHKGIILKLKYII